MYTSFRNLINLKHLTVCRCDFKNFDSRGFQFIPNLEVLRLFLPENHEHIDFSRLGHLKWFQISGVETYEFFETISDSLEVLFVSGIKNIDLFFDTFVQSKCRPRVLQMGYSEIVHFDAKYLSALNNMTHLMITEFGLQTANFDYDSFLSNLESLDLSENSIKELSFSKTLNLTQLSLSDNKNLNLQPSIFSSLKHLEILKLRNIVRNLTDYSIDPTVFKGLDNLLILDLSLNWLKTIDPNLFSYTPKLERLDLSSNKLSNLNNEMFKHLVNLKFLNLSSNRILSIEIPTFEYLKNIETLLLNSNMLDQLVPKTFNGLSKLQFLCLNNNRYETVDPEVFSDLPLLKKVILDDIDFDNQDELVEYFLDQYEISFTYIYK